MIVAGLPLCCRTGATLRRGRRAGRRGSPVQTWMDGSLAASARSSPTTCFVTAALSMPSIGRAQVDPRVQKSMKNLKSMTANLGGPKVEGKEAVGGKDASALYFGTTKMNKNFEVVDAIGKEDGKDGHALCEAWRRIHPCRNERAKAGRIWSGDWHCSGRSGAWIHQTEQNFLRKHIEGSESHLAALPSALRAHALAHAGTTQRRMVSAGIGTVFVQDSADAAREQWRSVADSCAASSPSSGP